MKHPLTVDLEVDHKDGEMYGSPIPDQKLIPSELIMSYLQRYFMCRLEGAAYFKTDPDELKNDLKALARFVRFTCGIHARLAFTNEVDRLDKIPNDKLMDVIKKTFLMKSNLF